MSWISRNKATGATVAAILFASLTVPARGKDRDLRELPVARASAGDESAGAMPSSSYAAGASSAVASPGSNAVTPSLEQVMELLRAQGQEIASLRAALHEQQELTARIEAKLLDASPESIAAEPAALALAARATGAGRGDLTQRVAELEATWGSSQKNMEARLRNLGPFAFSGDFRLRGEPTFGGPVDRSQDRLRERIRLRFNADAELNDQLKGGFSLASGDLDTPISTNQTLNQYDTRKPIAIDRAYATYNPRWFRQLTLTGGKFTYPWFNTELVWDKDLNPEGAGETLAFNVTTPVLKKLSFVGFQLPFAENKRTAATNKSLYNTMVYGEQLQMYWQLGPRVKLNAYASYYDWTFPDLVALSLLTANSASPDDGLLALSNAGEVNSIATVTSNNGITGAKTITSAQFASKFGIFDSLAQLDIATPSDRWPVSFIGDFAQNTRACENVRNIPAEAVYSAPCDPRARHGYWLEAGVGRAQKKGDWQFSYTRIMIQREAVIGAFNYSEIFPTSNVEIHRTEILYQLFDNVTLQLNGLFGRPIVNGGSPAPVRPLWERLQFDMTYKF